MEIDEANIDPYDQLGLTPTATEKEVRSAYRKKSREVHPDRNPDNPTAAHEFHILSLAQAILLDGPKRAILDVKLEEKRKFAERTAAYDSKKRVLVNDLVAREEAAFKKARQDAHAKSSSSAHEAGIQSEGRRMREAAAAAMLAAEDAARAEAKKQAKAAEKGKQKEAAYPSSSSPANGSEIPELERTLRLSLPLPAFAIDLASSSALTARIMPLYGSLEHAVILPSKKESSKKGSAMLVFPASNVSSAWALWDDCRTGQRGWAGVKAKWASGTEPAWVARLSQHPSTTSSTTHAAASPVSLSSSASHAPPAGGSAEIPSTPSFSFDPFAAVAPAPEPPKPTGTSSLDYESATLLRMRQAERARLEQEIRDAEGEDE